MAAERPSSSKHRAICVREEFKIAVKLALDKLKFDESQKGTFSVFYCAFSRNSCDFLRSKKFRFCFCSVVLEFPSSFTAVERAYVHRFCQNLGLNSKSRG